MVTLIIMSEGLAKRTNATNAIGWSGFERGGAYICYGRRDLLYGLRTINSDLFLASLR